MGSPILTHAGIGRLAGQPHIQRGVGLQVVELRGREGIPLTLSNAAAVPIEGAGATPTSPSRADQDGVRI